MLWTSFITKKTPIATQITIIKIFLLMIVLAPEKLLLSIKSNWKITINIVNNIKEKTKNFWIIIKNVIDLFLHKKNSPEKKPEKKPIIGSWIANNQNHIEPFITQANVSDTSPKIKPMIGPYIHPTTYIGNHEKDNDIPNIGIGTENIPKTNLIPNIIDNITIK